MAVAAKLTDPVQHSQVLEATCLGLLIGGLVGAAVIITAPVSIPLTVVVVGGAVVTGANVGAVLGGYLGGMEGVNDFLGGDQITGTLTTGAPTVLIHGHSAARAGQDVVDCQGTPPFAFLGMHVGKRVAQGSSSVYINLHRAARSGDAIECGAKIWVDVCRNEVLIGGATTNVLDVADEVPWQIGVTLTLLSAGFALVVEAPIALAAVALVGLGVAVSLGAGPIMHALGGAIYGQGSPEQALWTAYGGVFGNLIQGYVPSIVKAVLMLDPIDAGSGSVVDVAVDLALPGIITFEWRRQYSSARAGARTELGRGGFGHGLEQRVTRWPGMTVLRDEEGREVRFPPLAPGQSAFHRGERLTLTALAGGSFEVQSLDTRLTRAFAPSRDGADAVLCSIRDAHGNAITLAYERDELARVVDTAGRVVRVRRGHDGRILRLEVWADEQLQRTVSYAYSARGELERVVDAAGNTMSYAYDDQHRLVDKTLPGGAHVRYAYDERTGWCCRSGGDEGLHAGEIQVDLDARVTRLLGNEEPRTYHWNEDGLVLREETPDGALVRAWEYDADRLVIAETRGPGETTRYAYDARGNKIREVGPAGEVTTWEYHDDLPVRRVDPGEIETRYGYDARGALIRVTRRSRPICALGYDERGHLTSVRGDEGEAASFVYDARHDLVEARDPHGATTVYAYEALGRPVSRTDALGQRTTVDHDRLGRPVAVHLADGTTTELDYDAGERPVRLVDAEGEATVMEYAGSGVLTRLTRPDGGTWAFGYDGSERLQRITSPTGETRELACDAAGRASAETALDAWAPPGAGATVTFVRDHEGRLLGAALEQDGGPTVTIFDREAPRRVMAGAPAAAHPAAAALIAAFTPAAAALSLTMRDSHTRLMRIIDPGGSPISPSSASPLPRSAASTSRA